MNSSDCAVMAVSIMSAGFVIGLLVANWYLDPCRRFPKKLMKTDAMLDWEVRDYGWMAAIILRVTTRDKVIRNAVMFQKTGNVEAVAIGLHAGAARLANFARRIRP